MSIAPVCVESVRAADLLLGHDPWGSSWIAAHRARQAREAAARLGVSAPDAKGQGGGRNRRRAPAGRRPARAAALPARRRGGPRAQRDAGVRRRQLERNSHRLDLRRSRHLQEVQGADRQRGDAGAARSTRGRSASTNCATAGAWPAGRWPASDLVVEVPPLQTRPKAALVGVGRHVILRPSVQKRHLVLERADDGGPALGPAAGARRARGPRAERLASACCATWVACCERRAST